MRSQNFAYIGGYDSVESWGKERSLAEGQIRRTELRPRSVLHKRPVTLDMQKTSTVSAFASLDVPATKSSTTGSGQASMEYKFPQLPVDTYERKERFDAGLYVKEEVSYLHGRETRPPLFGWRPFNDPFSNDVRAPAPVLDRDATLFNPGLGADGPFYGRYLGPASPRGLDNGPPLTPVDKAAYIHDSNYGDIYNRYQYSEFEHGLSISRFLGTGDKSAPLLGWMGSHTSLDPAMQLELAWADAKLIGNSWAFTGEGIFKGFYADRRGENALITDLAWASAITVTYGAITAWRLAMVGVGLGYQIGRGLAGAFVSLGDSVGGDVGKAISGIGRLAVGAFDVAAGIFAVMGTVAFGTYVLYSGLLGAAVGGVVYVGGKLIQSVGDAINDAANWVGDQVDCFITEAVVATTAESDAGLRLQTLRAFRDEYVASIPGGRRLLLTYIERAPAIVAAINAHPERQRLWEDIRTRWIDPAVREVRRGQKQVALSIYTEMVNELSALFAVDMTYDGARGHWKRDPRLAIN